MNLSLAQAVKSEVPSVSTINSQAGFLLASISEDTRKWVSEKLVVTKTDHHIYAQIIDDATSKVLTSSSTLTLKLKGNNVQNAKKVGTDIAKKAKDLKITAIAFDRGGNKYHGRVKALADAAREAGLKF